MNKLNAQKRGVLSVLYKFIVSNALVYWLLLVFSACAQKESSVNAALIKCMLDEAHMEVNAVDIHKHSALWYAVCSENTPAVQLLLQNGAHNIMDGYECTVLMTAGKGMVPAASGSSLTCISLLLRTVAARCQ